MKAESLEKTTRLRDVDRIEVTSIVDNYSDALLALDEYVESTPSNLNKMTKRAPLIVNNKLVGPPLAEHGLCLLIKVLKNNENHMIIFDAGVSGVAVLYNLKLLGIDLRRVETIVLSHGHPDHIGSLRELLTAIGRNVPIIAHPDVFLRTRFLKLPGGQRIDYPFLHEEALVKLGAEVIKTRKPLVLASGMLTTTGEIERITDFERGMSSVFLERDGKIEQDRILDDLAIIASVKDKGLVVVSGCAHAGIVNTVYQAQKVAGVGRTHAILGGFHLREQFAEQVTGRTILELKKLNPKTVVPMHCTSWKAIDRMAKEMPSEFILNSVGTTFTFDQAA